LICLIWLLMIAIAIPQYSDYSNRSRNMHLLAELHRTEARAAISLQLLADPHTEIDASMADQIPTDWQFRIRDDQRLKTSYKSVARDGTMIVVFTQIGTVMVLHPEVRDGEVEWSCQASSIHGIKAIPRRCREP
jgi:hypothetical protein